MPKWFFIAFVFVGIIGASVTLAYCVYVSVKEARSKTLLRKGP